MRKNVTQNMISSLVLIGLALCTAGTPAHAASDGPATFYVATNGNDASSGSRQEPFATPLRALEAAREARPKSPGTKAEIVVRGGTYFLADPLVLTPEDSGLAIKAHENEQPILSGGKAITGWREILQGNKLVWIADVPDARENAWFFRELWVDGQRAIRARHPNVGYLPVIGLLDKSADWTQGHWRFKYRAGDFPSSPTVTNAEVMVMTRWVESRLPLTNVDQAEHVLSCSKRSVFELSAGDVFYAEGAPDFLDYPGEWYLDSTAGRLYYIPMPGQTTENTVAVAPVLMQILRLEGDPASGKFIENVQFNGLAFSHTEWCFPTGFASGKHRPNVHPQPDPNVGGFAQAAIGVPGAVWGEGVRNSKFENCRFVNLGNYGLELSRACSSNRITGCDFAQLGGGGIKLGETSLRPNSADATRDNTVENCRIHHGGRMFHSAIGVWIGQSPGNQILHNSIHDFYYTGISVGWTWGYSQAFATNTTVAFNHVHHIGVQSDGDGPILSDMSGIYTLGKQHGSVILNNLWHDVAGIHYGGWGIYFDEGTSGILAASNVVYRTTHGGFHQHYGATNQVFNNIFAFARDYQVQRTRPEPHLSFSFRTNIVYFDTGVLFGGNLAEDKYDIDHNLYWDLRSAPNPTRNLGPCSWDEWLRRGHDTHSVWANPHLANPDRNDFSLKGDSPAFKLGFKPIDLSKVGPIRSFRNSK